MMSVTPRGSFLISHLQIQDSRFKIQDSLIEGRGSFLISHHAGARSAALSACVVSIHVEMLLLASRHSSAVVLISVNVALYHNGIKDILSFFFCHLKA